MIKLFKNFLIILSLVTFTNCSTILNGTKQNITINTNISGASVYINGIERGKTPFIGSIKRDDETTLMIKKDGYIPQTIALNTELETAFWGNFLFIYGSASSSTTDYVNGAAHEYSPSTYYVTLEKDDSTKKK